MLTIKRGHVLRIPIIAFLYFFLIIWQFDLTYLSRFEIVDTVYKLGKVASFAIIVVITLMRGTYRMTRMFLFIICYSAVLVLSTIINNGPIFSAVSSGASLIAMYLIIHEMLQTEPKAATSIFMLMFGTMIYANVILMLLYPRGLYNTADYSTRFYWLFGQQNSNVIYSLCTIIAAIIYKEMHKGDRVNTRVFLLIFASYVNVIITGSATGILGIVIMTIVIIVNWKKPLITLYHGIIVSTAVFVIIVLLRKQNIIVTMITILLHRDLTFSGRFVLWSTAIEEFLKRPILGAGIETTTVFTMLYGFETPHNKVLFTLYQGGVLLLISLMGAIFSAAESLKSRSGSKTAMVLNAVLIAFVIQMQAESYVKTIFFFPFILTDYLYELSDQTITDGKQTRALGHLS